MEGKMTEAGLGDDACGRTDGRTDRKTNTQKHKNENTKT